LRCITCAAGILLAIGLLTAGARPASAVSEASELCTGDPCVINGGPHLIDHFSTLDFGSAQVILNGTLDVADGSMAILAGSFQIAASGQILAKGVSTSEEGGSIDIDVENDILIDGTSSTGAIVLTGCGGGFLTLESSSGDIRGAGRINMNRIIQCVLSGDGGFFGILDAVEVDLSGAIDGVGGMQAAGGVVDITARGAVSLGPLNLDGGELDAGTLDITSGGAVTLSDIDATSTGIVGQGGLIDVFSSGPIELLGSIRALGATDPIEGDDGGDVTLFAGSNGQLENVRIATTVQVNGRGDFGRGGTLQIDGAEVSIEGTVSAGGGGVNGGAGVVDIFASDLLSLTGGIDARSGGDSTLSLISAGNLDVLAPIDGGGSSGTNGGAVVLKADEVLTVANEVLASGATFGATLGGSITLDGCEVGVLPSIDIEAAKEGGTITVRAGQQMTLAGDFVAGPSFGLIELRHRDAGTPPDTTGASFNITPSTVVDGLIPPCAICTGLGDADLDGIDDSCDSCTGEYNPLQGDTDGDGFGNACDCDFDQSDTCGIDDFNLFLPDFSSGIDSGIGTDMDESSAVGISDFNLFLPGFSAGFPGPSALRP
jgi:hypothetical protein